MVVRDIAAGVCDEAHKYITVNTKWLSDMVGRSGVVESSLARQELSRYGIEVHVERYKMKGQFLASIKTSHKIQWFWTENFDDVVCSCVKLATVAGPATSTTKPLAKKVSSTITKNTMSTLRRKSPTKKKRPTTFKRKRAPAAKKKVQMPHAPPRHWNLGIDGIRLLVEAARHVECVWELF